MDAVALGGRTLLVLVFVVAATGKLVDRAGARRALADFRVPRRFVMPIGWLLPLTELAVAVLLFVQPLSRAAAFAAAGLLALFMVGVTAAMVRGEAPDCNCFGQIGSAPAGRGTLIRNAVLGAVAVFIGVYGPGTDPGSWLSPRTNAEVAVLILVVGAVSLAVVAWSFRSERRELRRELVEAQETMALLPAGLPVGAQAPGFELPTPDGQRVSLTELLARGRPVALVFVSPSCRPCHYMFPDIARWQQSLSERLTITLVVHGELAETADLAGKFGLANTLSDPKADVFRVYRGQGTPSMVIVTPEGRVGIRIRSSHGAVEAAIRRALETDPSAGANGTAAAAATGGSTLTVSRWSPDGARPA
jgi:cytochrome oxidase Cu insertion factor (SCO1/SenC/PrrC family)